MTPVGSVPGVAAEAGVSALAPRSIAGPSTGAAPIGGEIPFSHLLSGLLSDVSQQQQQVGTELQKVVTGETDHVHDLVVSVAKADLALRLVIEVRDQLISSYQEVMRMQM